MVDTSPSTASDKPESATGAVVDSYGPGGQPTPGPLEGPEREFTVAARSQRKMVLQRFLQHRLAVLSAVVLVLMIVLSLAGGRFWKYTYAEQTDDFSKPPSIEHPMGTNSIGQDNFAQVLRGAQKSVQIALVVAAVSTTWGALIGALSGFYRGRVDAVLMRLTDLLLVIPPLIIFAMLAARFASREGSWLPLALLLAAVSWGGIARVVRGVFLSLREKEFVEAARALGASDRRIMFKHLLPNAVGPIIVNATITVAVAILVETSLSYLGLGIRAPDTSLGKLIADNQQAARTRPWLFYFPGMFIITIALSVNFLGDGLRDAFDPTQRRVRA